MNLEPARPPPQKKLGFGLEIWIWKPQFTSGVEPTKVDEFTRGSGRSK